MKKKLVAILSLIFLGAMPAFSAETVDSIIEKVNQRIDAESLELQKLSKDNVISWFNDYLPFGFVKEDRNPIFKGLQSGILIDPYTIEIDLRENIPVPNLKPQIVFKGPNFSMAIVEGNSYTFYSDFARQACNPVGTCKEDFHGDLPPQHAANFPTSVPVRVNEKSAQGTCLVGSHCVHDILDVEIEISQENIGDVLRYFHGIERSVLKTVLEKLLGNDSHKWISINSVLLNWAGKKANTFPVDGDNEVCHGPARQFYNATLLNGTYDRSTEPVAILLKDFYCAVPEKEEPGFGDYLYVPARHSGRFILKDPASGRWIAFSVQSGGISAFRFWWVDEDFSGKPFDRKPLPDFRERFVDVWRRCR